MFLLLDHLSHLHHHQSISPEELTALESVLQLIKAVAEQVSFFEYRKCSNKAQSLSNAHLQ